MNHDDTPSPIGAPAPEHQAAAAAAVRAAPPILVGSMEPITRARLLQVEPDTLLAEVAALLLQPHIGVVVVSDGDGAAVGVITETVLIHQFAFGSAEVFKTLAGEVMLHDFHSCSPSDSLPEVLAAMQAHALAYMLVVQDGERPLGVLNVRDGLRALLAAGNYQEELLRNYVMGVGYQ